MRENQTFTNHSKVRGLKGRALVMPCVWLVSILSSSAAVVTWDGNGGSGNAWLTANNWDPNGVPTINDVAKFLNPGTATLIGINFNSITAVSGVRTQSIGQIYMSEDANGGRNRFIGNSSSSVPIADTSVLLIQGVDGILLKNDSAFNLTLRSTSSTADATLKAVMQVQFGTAGQINVTGLGTITISSVIRGVNGFTKTGSGTLILSPTTNETTGGSVNTFTGNVIVQEGTLQVSSAGAFGAAPATPTSGVVTLHAGATLEATGTVNSSTNRGFYVGPSSGSGSTTINTNANTVTLNGLVENTPGGSGRIIKTGSGSLVFATSANTFTGGLDIREGSVSAVNDSRLGTAPASPEADHLAIHGGTLNFTGGFTLNANRGITLGPSTGSGSGTLSVQDAGDTLTYAGVIANNGSGAGQLIKTGAGTLRLTGDSTFTGGTTILAGILSVNSGTALGLAPASPTPGYITVNGGTLEFTNTFTLSTNRGIALGPTSGSGSGTLSVTGTATLTYGGAVADNVAGTGSLTKTGTGTLVFTGANVYSGGTTVSQGTLLANNAAGSATGTGSVSVITGTIIGGNGAIGTTSATPDITIDSGGFLRVGSTHDLVSGTAADLALSTSGVDGQITLNGTVQFDLFARTAGANSTSNNDLLLFNSLNPIALSGALQVRNSTGLGSETWAEGDSWQLFSWTGITGGTPTSGGFSSFDLPVLAEGLQFDTSALYTTGVLSITVVPEPSRGLLLMLGIGWAVTRRQRLRD